MTQRRDTSAIVTGGAGFIGSHLVDRLLAAGGRVTVIDDFSTGSLANLAQHHGNPALTVREASILDARAMEEIVAGHDCVFHLACRNVRLSLRHPTIVHEVNATGTLNVLKAAAKARVRRFLYCSSSEVNGTAEQVPMPEDYHFKPETIYGASKLAGEYYTQVFQRSGWCPTVIVRPHNNYGPREHYQGDKGEVIPRFILWALSGKPPVVYGSGGQTRDFTYVEETADFLVRLMEHDPAEGTTVNLCRGDEVSILEIARIIAELTGLALAPVHVPGRPSDVLRLFGDNSRLRALLGDAPGIGIRDGLARTVAWFRHNVPLSAALLDSLSVKNWEDGGRESWLPEPDMEPAAKP
jgi:UDP-glucose 4-epimerase